MSAVSPPIALASNMRGRPTDSPDVRISKTLSYILRHGAANEGLTMRPDGYIKVSDMLARPKLKGVDMPMLQKIVAENEKQRYQLSFESLSVAGSEPSASTPGIWWIRANQGHSLKVEALELQPVTSAEEVPVAVHGTNHRAWETISKQGLSKMSRNHIHLATGLPSAGVKSGMREKSPVLIYIDVPKALNAGIKFYLSANGVVLTEGDERGFLAPEYFEKVEVGPVSAAASTGGRSNKKPRAPQLKRGDAASGRGGRDAGSKISTDVVGSLA